MPDLTFTPLWEGGDLHDVRLGQVLVGRTSEHDGKGRWICWLAGDMGLHSGTWKDEKSPQAARNAITARVQDWLRLAGVA